jgi:hypothetical protein
VPILTRFKGGTNKALDLQNPDNLGQQSTDNGVVPNLKWSFSDSRARILKGGWSREQVVTDLPVSVDISAAQQHLSKGAIRELHWHRVVGLCPALMIRIPRNNHSRRLSGVTFTRDQSLSRLLTRMGNIRLRNWRLAMSGISPRGKPTRYRVSV